MLEGSSLITPDLIQGLLEISPEKYFDGEFMEPKVQNLKLISNLVSECSRHSVLLVKLSLLAQ